MKRYVVDGGTAVLTGAAGGIGRATAHELASRGSNLVLPLVVTNTLAYPLSQGAVVFGVNPVYVDLRVKFDAMTESPDQTMMDNAKDDLLDRRTSEEFEAARQEADKLITEIEKLFPQVQQIVASSDFGRDAIEKAKAIVEKARAAIDKKDAAAVKEQLEGLTRTHRMFKGVVAKT